MEVGDYFGVTPQASEACYTLEHVCKLEDEEVCKPDTTLAEVAEK